ncbi:MAG: class I SAM-dependent methyltransferase [Bacteroidia bacterium]|nr:class I SAM-dependent methyltransferase [Bacteroidia bacterium]
MKNLNDAWYKCWFNTSYYHTLYKNRNNEEAALFLDKLVAHLKLTPNSSVWDMACGKGRHTTYLAKKGFNSFGTDISENSIAEASQQITTNYPSLHFFVHDMRNPLRINYFDCVLNIFTSLGYFENDRDDERVFQSAFQSCKSGGYVVVDFLNAIKVLNHLVPEEKKTESGIEFNIKRKLENNSFKKEISFFADGQDWNFEESVKAYKKEDLLRMAIKAGFSGQEFFGNYNLDTFDEINSDRLILILRKV